MSERTEQNKKSELAITTIVLVVVASLALPLAFSSFRDNVSLVAGLLQATPFILLACAIGSVIYASKMDKE